MDPNVIFIKDMIDGVLERHLPIADNISSLIHPNPEIATKSIIKLIKKTIYEFSKYRPMPRITTVELGDNNQYTFIDNYDSYAEGLISIDDLELVPSAIARCAAGVNWDLTANYWRYFKPTLYGSQGAYMIKAIYEYPLYLKYDDNGLLLPESHIFGISDGDDLGAFNDHLDYTILMSIQRRSELVQLPQSIQFLNLNGIIQELAESIRVNTEASSALSIAWF